MLRKLNNPNALFGSALVAALTLSVVVVMASLTEAILGAQAFL
jgi:hypothetical protein